MEDHILVSVIALNYNQYNYCLETLESIIGQTYKNLEIIIIDNASDDGSTELISNWFNKSLSNTNHKLILNENNIGICNAINQGLNLIQGGFVSLISCDDVMYPNKIEKQVKILSTLDPSYYCIYSDAAVINSESDTSDYTWKQIMKLNGFPSGYIFEHLLNNYFIVIASQLFRRSIFKDIGPFDPNITFEDLDFNLRASQKFKCYFHDYISIKYRKHKDNFSADVNTKLLESYLYLLMKHYDMNKSWNKIIVQKIKNQILNSYLQDIDLGKKVKSFVESKYGKEFSVSHIKARAYRMYFKLQYKLVSIIKYFVKLDKFMFIDIKGRLDLQKVFSK